MIDDWSRTAEQLMLSTIESKIRVVAITSPVGGAGTSTVAIGLAQAFAQAKRKTLLIDFSTSAQDDVTGDWAPGKPLPPDAIKVGSGGLAVLTAAVTPSNRAVFGNIDLLAKFFQHDLASYDSIILDLPAIDAASQTAINPVAAARAADAVFLVGLTGLTLRGEMTDAMQKLRQVGANVTGVVLNDQFCATLGEEIADVSYTRLGRHFPRAAQWIAHKALAAASMGQHFRIVR
jgi:Mrp family chromosome partitioning ATPase